MNRLATVLAAAALATSLVTLVLVADLKTQVVSMLVHLEAKVDGDIKPTR